MKTFLNSDWLRAVRLIPNSANFCYLDDTGLEKTFTGKTNMPGGQGSANSENISSKFEVNSTLILPVKECCYHAITMLLPCYYHAITYTNNLHILSLSNEFTESHISKLSSLITCMRVTNVAQGDIAECWHSRFSFPLCFSFKNVHTLSARCSSVFKSRVGTTRVSD